VFYQKLSLLMFYFISKDDINLFERLFSFKIQIAKNRGEERE